MMRATFGKSSVAGSRSSTSTGSNRQQPFVSFASGEYDSQSAYSSTTGFTNGERSHQRVFRSSSSIPSSRKNSYASAKEMRHESETRSTGSLLRSNDPTNPRPSSVLPETAAAPLEPNLCVMSVVEEGSHISFCCYNEQLNEIMVETCTATGYETESLVERFLQVARPNMVLIGNRIVNNIPLLDMVTRQPKGLPFTEEEGKQTPTPPSSSSIPYRVLKSGIFDVRICKMRILQKLQVLSMLRREALDEASDRRRNNYCTDSDRNFPQSTNSDAMTFRPSSFHYLAAVIDFNSKVLVQALGALLSYLQTTVFQLEEGNQIIVNRIVKAKISDYMVISQSTFSALNIFSVEHHPLIAKGQGHSKEGFSLYSLLDRTKSRGGRQLLREWMLKPLINLEGICTRQDVIEFFLHPSLQTSVGILSGLLQKIGPIDKILLRIQKCTVKPRDFLVLTTTLSAAISISSVLRNDILGLLEAGQPNILSTELCSRFFSEMYLQCNVELLMDLRERITAIVDSELTLENNASFVVIRHGFHEQLDAWKEQYECLDETLVRVAKDLCQKHSHLEGLTVIFIPQVGYLVGLMETLIPHTRVSLPPDFEQIFVQDGEVFFKCDEMRRMDDEIGDLDGAIKDKERMIVTELEDNILDTENELRECFNALSTLDCILSFADCTAELDLTRPQLVDDDNSDDRSQPQKQIIYVRHGRHPLQEIICENAFVKNDVKMDNSNRIVCITGPNCSGKSCYMRQVGLLVYMAHLGCFIPCSKAIISITDQIFARVSAIETCSRPQSSYQLELTEMASIILKATAKSLVLIDEFGKGTNPASGIAILGASLKRLSNTECKVVCTTHFLELFTMDVITDGGEGIRACQMTIHLPEGKEDGAAPLFKLKDGVASSSAALVCAKNAGLSHTVIKRAEEVIRTMRARKFIRALPEAMRNSPKFSEAETEMLKCLLTVNSWESVDENNIMQLLQLLAKVIPE